MKGRTLLSDDQGVEWANPKNATRVLFSYNSARHVRPGLQKAQCLTTGKPVLVENGAFISQPSHMYRITVGK